MYGAGARAVSRSFGPIFQTAYVVPDFDAALAHWTGTLGVGPFFSFPVPLDFDWLERGGERIADHDIFGGIALGYSGDMLVEIIAPGPAPSPYADFLAAGRSGVHHIGTVASDYDAQMAAARAAGIGVALEGVLPLARFAYLATDRDFAGTMIELVEMTALMHETLATIRAASVGWDGRDPVRGLG